jgi:hypothetical protein
MAKGSGQYFAFGCPRGTKIVLGSHIRCMQKQRDPLRHFGLNQNSSKPKQSEQEHRGNTKIIEHSMPRHETHSAIIHSIDKQKVKKVQIQSQYTQTSCTCFDVNIRDK